MENQNNRQLVIMRWISFLVVTGLLVYSACSAIQSGKETDKILAGLFLVGLALAWGADVKNIWKFYKRDK